MKDYVARLTFEKKNLLPAVQAAAAVVARRPMNPIMGGVMIRAEEDHVILSATDMEAAIRLTVPAEIEDAGEEHREMVVDAAILARITKAVQNGSLSIFKVNTGQGTEIKVEDGTTSYRIPFMSPTGYPQLPELSKTSFKVSSETLAKALRRVLYVPVDRDDERQVYQCIYWSVKGNDATITATDGARGSLVRFPVEGSPDLKKSAAAYVQSMAQVEKLLGKSGEKGGEAQISIDGRIFQIKIGDTVYSVRMVEQEAPDLESIIEKLPESPRSWVRVQRAKLLDAVERVSVIDQKHTIVILGILPGLLSVQTSNMLQGEALEKIPAETNGQELHTVAVRAEYLSDFLKSTDADLVKIGWEGAHFPVDLRGEGEDWYRHVMMPVRL